MNPKTSARLKKSGYTKAQKLTIFGQTVGTHEHLSLNKIRTASRNRTLPEDIQIIRGKKRSPSAMQLKAAIHEKYFQKERGKIRIGKILEEERIRIGKSVDPLARHEKLWNAFYREMKNHFSSNPDARAVFERAMYERFNLQVLAEACQEKEIMDIQKACECLDIGINANRLKRMALRREEKKKQNAKLNPRIDELDNEFFALRRTRFLIGEVKRVLPDMEWYPCGGGGTLVESKSKVKSFEEVVQTTYGRSMEIPPIKPSMIRQIMINHRERLNQIIGLERARILEENESVARTWIRQH